MHIHEKKTDHNDDGDLKYTFNPCIEIWAWRN